MLLIEKLLADREMRQNALARAAGMSPATVSLIISGRLLPYDKQLVAMAQAVSYKGQPADLIEQVDG
ncbi:MAG: helix-turn-helix transcriptional regulator [Actinomycetota bacterium]|nr:helix-turn-helix transcriptional regulator [Actinomycetota bacterium]